MRLRTADTRTAVALAATMALGTALLTACGGDSSASADGLTTVAVGTGGNIFDLPLKVADANGYFRKQGLKIKYVTLTAATGPSALQAGSVQFLHDSPTGFVTALSKGLPETALAADGLGNPLGLVVSKKFAQDHDLTASTPAADVAKALADSTAGASSANTKAEAADLPQVPRRRPHQAEVGVTAQPGRRQGRAQQPRDRLVRHLGTAAPADRGLRRRHRRGNASDRARMGRHALRIQPVRGGPEELRERARRHREEVRHGRTAGHRLHADPSRRQAGQDGAGRRAEGAARRTGQGPRRQSRTGRLAGFKSSMDAATWNTTTAFIDAMGALPDGAEVTTSDWTNTYLP